MELKVDTNFEGKLICASKIAWGIWQIFTTEFESLKIGTLMTSFYLKLKRYDHKICSGVMFHDNEEWYKNRRRIDLSAQNWHQKFDKFWPEHSKISKMCNLMGCFWPKYVMFELKKYRGITFYDTEYWSKIWSITDLCFQKWHEQFSKLLAEHFRKSKNWDFDGILLSKVGQGHSNVTCVTFGNKN